MLNKEEIQEKIREYKIEDYLATIGSIPVKSSAIRDTYLCPIHDERTGSFMVYKDDDKDRYKCFGCGVSGDIINLISECDKISLREAFFRVVGNIEYSATSYIDRYIAKIEEEKNPEESIDNLNLKFTLLCKNFLKTVNKDKEYCKKIDKFYNLIDRYTIVNDISSLEKGYEKISEEIFPNLVKEYEEQNQFT